MNRNLKEINQYVMEIYVHLKMSHENDKIKSLTKC